MGDISSDLNIYLMVKQNYIFTNFSDQVCLKNWSNRIHHFSVHCAISSVYYKQHVCIKDICLKILRPETLK